MNDRSQFCSAFRVDGIKGLLAGSNSIGPIVYVVARASILYGPLMGLFKGYSGPPIKLEDPGQWGELARGSTKHHCKTKAEMASTEKRFFKEAGEQTQGRILSRKKDCQTMNR